MQPKNKNHQPNNSLQAAWKSPLLWLSIIGVSFLGLCAYPILSKNFEGTNCIQVGGKIRGLGEGYIQNCTEKPTRDFMTLSVYFDSGSSQIPLSELPKMQKYAKQIEKSSATTVTLVGHTDKTPGIRFKNHQALSKTRAESVRHQLIDYGVTKKITTLAVGHTSPIFKSNDVEDESQSRRVEIEISR
jgi:outer membrane protein OmpA-like peptidoglycan-associated protein